MSFYLMVSVLLFFLFFFFVFCFVFFFFFQAEDGIRDVAVTGVQTCALPICRISCSRRKTALVSKSCTQQVLHRPRTCRRRRPKRRAPRPSARARGRSCVPTRSEERRVGKECRDRGWEGE